MQLDNAKRPGKDGFVIDKTQIHSAPPLWGCAYTAIGCRVGSKSITDVTQYLEFKGLKPLSEPYWPLDKGAMSTASAPCLASVRNISQ